MYKKSFLLISAVLVLSLVNGAAFGYPDQNDYSIVTGEPVIDGVISDGEWGAATWIDMDKVYSESTPDLSEAKWAAMWSPGTNLIYVVITGTDTDHNFNSSYVDWNTQDDVEIHIDAGNTDVTDADRAYYRDTMRYAQHYFIGSDGSSGEWSYILDRAADSAIPGGCDAGVDGDVITYEFALTPYTDLNLDNPAGSAVKTLAIGDVVGLDMIMCTKSSGDFGMLCENTQMGKWKDASTFLDHTLVGAPVRAHTASPSDGQTDVAPDVVLSWMPGKYAAFHDAYFGTDYNDVNDANTSDSAGIYRGRQNLDANSYDTNDYDADGLFPGRTYYWRIDEVNEADPCSPWKGFVFSFTIECDMVVADQFDWDDLAAFAQQWLVEGGTTALQGFCCGADLDHNGRVDFVDFALLGVDWLKNLLPVADAGPDQQTLDSDGNGSEVVVLDGSASLDPDGTIDSYVWKKGPSQIATGVNPAVELDVGGHTITLTVTDDDGDTDTDTVVIIINQLGSGTTYHVDFDTGSDDSNGLWPSHAWKHCPCDDNAGGVSAATVLTGGDTVIFKGGVHYRGAIKVNTSGDLGDPILFDGDTSQNWGSGKAVIDGSELLTGWTPCSSAEDCGGASNWQSMYKTTLPGGVDKDVWQLNLMEDDVLLGVAQGPNPSDPFFYDNTSTYKAVPPSAATSTSIVDASFFTQPGASDWDGAYIHVWATTNRICTSKITGYSPSAHTIYFETLDNPPYTQYDTRYAMGNSVLVLDRAGEYVLDETSGEVYLWPYTGGDISNVEITVSVHENGFDFNGKSNIILQGFKIMKFSDGFDAYGSGAGVRNNIGGAGNLIIRGNELLYNRSMCKCAAIDIRASASNVTIENNHIRRNVRNRGVLTIGSDITIADNLLEENGGTGIVMLSCSNSEIIGNTVLDHTGMHANGITAYQNCSNVLIFGNTVLRGNCALTTQDSSSITMAYNILHKYGGGYCVADWTWESLHSTNLHYYNNVILNGGPPALYTGGSGLIVTNNIIDGWGGSYNIDTSVVSKSTVFVNYANFDYHLKAGSPAIDAGTNVGYSEDIEGNAVPTGSAVDIGAYEYQP